MGFMSQTIIKLKIKNIKLLDSSSLKSNLFWTYSNLVWTYSVWIHLYLFLTYINRILTYFDLCKKFISNTLKKYLIKDQWFWFILTYAKIHLKHYEKLFNKKSMVWIVLNSHSHSFHHSYYCGFSSHLVWLSLFTMVINFSVDLHSRISFF